MATRPGSPALYPELWGRPPCHEGHGDTVTPSSVLAAGEAPQRTRCLKKARMKVAQGEGGPPAPLWGPPRSVPSHRGPPPGIWERGQGRGSAPCWGGVGRASQSWPAAQPRLRSCQLCAAPPVLSDAITARPYRSINPAQDTGGPTKHQHEGLPRHRGSPGGVLSCPVPSSPIYPSPSILSCSILSHPIPSHPSHPIPSILSCSIPSRPISPIQSHPNLVPSIPT